MIWTFTETAAAINDEAVFSKGCLVIIGPKCFYGDAIGPGRDILSTQVKCL